MDRNADADTLFPHAARLLRDRNTHCYFTGHGWSQDPSQAQVFNTIVDAATACVSHNLHDVDLVLRTPLTGTELFSTAIR